jgi:hypothetical protein
MKHTKELFSLENKVAIVTGGRGLYGASISTGLCEMGASVVIASRNGQKCDEFAKTLRDQGYDAVGMSLDLDSDESIKDLVKRVIERYGKIDIVYGSRSKDDLVDYQEIIDEWCQDENINVYLTIDREQEGWDGHVGFVPNYVKELGFDTGKTVVLCGPPIMIKFTLEGLCSQGFDKKQIYTTLELKMKCGIGKCGRCNIGSKYVCKDGPVFRCDQIDELPDEY